MNEKMKKRKLRDEKKGNSRKWSESTKQCRVWKEERQVGGERNAVSVLLARYRGATCDVTISTSHPARLSNRCCVSANSWNRRPPPTTKMSQRIRHVSYILVHRWQHEPTTLSNRVPSCESAEKVQERGKQWGL
jgi:hypothetical protein